MSHICLDGLHACLHDLHEPELRSRVCYESQKGTSMTGVETISRLLYTQLFLTASTIVSSASTPSPTLTTTASSRRTDLSDEPTPHA